MARKSTKRTSRSTARAKSRTGSERVAPAVSPSGASETVDVENPGRPSDDLLDPDRRVRIQERAYLFYVESGYQHGHALDHWLEAERQIGDAGEPDRRQ